MPLSEYADTPRRAVTFRQLVSVMGGDDGTSMMPIRCTPLVVKPTGIGPWNVQRTYLDPSAMATF